MAKRKTYVLDTNTLIESPYAIFSFDEHDVVITDATLEELDKLKTAPGEKGVNARETIRELDKLREAGELSCGVRLPMGGGTFRIELNHLKAELPETWDPNSPDNRILRVCKGLSQTDKQDVILVSNDINVRIKADIIGVAAEGYKSERMGRIDEQYTGRTVLTVKAGVIDRFFTDKGVHPADIAYRAEVPELMPNEFVLLKSSARQSGTALGRYDGNRIVPLRHIKSRPYGVQPRNAGQRFLTEALMAPVDEAPLVIAKGPAGTAKTFLSLAAGLEQTVGGQSSYRQILVVRPNVKFDDDIGYLKGTEEEKIGPLIRPVMDNLGALTRIKHEKGSTSKDGAVLPDSYVQELFDRNIIVAQAMAYMRGRSISDTWILIDEAQNMSPMQAFGIVSRAGVGSKVILAGDPEQIDNPRLDSRTNGLSFTAERMKGSSLCWQVTLDGSECVRSPLALEAVERLSPKGYGAGK